MSTQTIIFIVLTIALIAAGTGIFFAVSKKGPFKGTVIEYETGTPIANVSVTDGRHVVKTDENGNFKLKGYIKTRFITVTAPSGYIAENFYRDAEKNVKSYDFTLKKSKIPAGAGHSFLQISDSEVDEKGVGEWKNDILEHIEKNKPAFLIHTGDICYEAGLKTHYGDMNSENMGLPVYYAIGNHDYVDGKYGEELYESIYGPVWYSFEVGNVHYAVTPFHWGDKSSRYGRNERWRWLENDLKNTSSDMKVVIFNHEAPVGMPMDDNYVLKFGRKRLDLMKHNLIAWVYGHYHYNYSEEKSGVIEISTARPDCGGIDESPAASRLVSVNNDGKISTKLLYLAFSKSSAVVPQNAKWISSVDGNPMFGKTILQDEKLYITTADDDYPKNCGIYCLNSRDGSLIWKYKTKNSVRNDVVLADGKAVTQDSEGNVYCLNAENGKLIWQTRIDLKPSISTETGICIDDSTVYAGCAVKITALDLNSGEIKFKKKRKKGECSPARLLIKNNKLILSAHWDCLAALDKTSCREIWKSKDDALWARSSTPSFINDNTILVAESNAVMTISLSNGEILNKTIFEEYSFANASTPLIIENTAYIATATRGVIAYSLSTQKMLWNIDVEPSMLCTPPYVAVSNTVEASIISDGENIIFAALDGYIYIANAKSGKIINKTNIGVPVISTPAIDDKSIYISDFTGRVICIDK